MRLFKKVASKRLLRRAFLYEKTNEVSIMLDRDFSMHFRAFMYV